MAYGSIPRFEPAYGNRYGFRQRVFAPATSGVDQPIPQSPVAPPPAQPTAQPYHSGPSAEGIDNNDSVQGPGSTLDGSPVPEVNAPHYASQHEALAYGRSAFDNGYYGTVQDAAAANLRGNTNATGTLQGFVGSGPTGRVQAPGTLGFIGTHIADAAHGGPRYDNRNITDSLRSLSDSGDLYNNDNSSGYFGNDLHTQQTVSDVDATNTFGDWSTVADRGGPEIFHDSLDTQEVQQAEQQANYDHYQDNSSDDNHGQTDGTQTGGETSHAGGYGGYADDTASGGGGGGGGK